MVSKQFHISVNYWYRKKRNTEEAIGFHDIQYQTQLKINGMGLNKLVSALIQHLVIPRKQHVTLAANRLPLQTRHSSVDLNPYIVNLVIRERIHPREALWSRVKSGILDIKFFKHTANRIGLYFGRRVIKAYIRLNTGRDGWARLNP